MEIAIYQILAPILAFAMGGASISKFRRGQVGLGGLVLSLLFWGMVAGVSIFPDFFVPRIETWTGFKSGTTGLLFLSVLFLGSLVFFLLRQNEKRQQEITEIVRTLALQKKEKKKKD